MDPRPFCISRRLIHQDPCSSQRSLDASHSVRKCTRSLQRQTKPFVVDVILTTAVLFPYPYYSVSASHYCSMHTLIVTDRTERRASHSLAFRNLPILRCNDLPFHRLLVLHIQMSWDREPYAVRASRASEAPSGRHQVTPIYSYQGECSRRSLRSWAGPRHVGDLLTETRRRLVPFQPQ